MVILALTLAPLAIRLVMVPQARRPIHAFDDAIVVVSLRRTIGEYLRSRASEEG